MKPSMIAATAEALMDAEQPFFLWGPPGVGKSQVLQQVAAKTKRQFLDLRLPLLDAVDLRGIPYKEGNVTRWLPPSFLPREGRGLLCLEEFASAFPVVQAAASSLILD